MTKDEICKQCQIQKPCMGIELCPYLGKSISLYELIEWYKEYNKNDGFSVVRGCPVLSFIYFLCEKRKIDIEVIKTMLKEGENH
jgi:hypothetical protein